MTQSCLLCLGMTYNGSAVSFHCKDCNGRWNVVLKQEVRTLFNKLGNTTRLATDAAIQLLASAGPCTISPLTVPSEKRRGAGTISEMRRQLMVAGGWFEEGNRLEGRGGNVCEKGKRLREGKNCGK